MEIKKTRKIEEEYVDDIICDSCGESCKKQEYVIDNEDHPKYGQKAMSFEFMKLSAGWGYDSKKDMEHWEAHICEKCVDDKLSFINFKKSRLRFSTVIEKE